MSSATLERPYTPPPQPVPAFELEQGEKLISMNDEAITSGGFTKDWNKLRDRYKLIGMTRRQHEYMCALWSFQTTPGLPYASDSTVAEKMQVSSHTVYTIKKELIQQGHLIMRPGYMPTDGRLIYYKDTSQAFQQIIDLDDPDKMRKAQIAYANKLLVKSEQARQAGMQRWKNVGHEMRYSGEAFYAPQDNEMQNVQNSMRNRRVYPAESTAESTAVSQGNRDLYKEIDKEDTYSNLSKPEKEEFLGVSQNGYMHSSPTTNQSITPTNVSLPQHSTTNDTYSRETSNTRNQVGETGAARADVQKKYETKVDAKKAGISYYQQIVMRYGKPTGQEAQLPAPFKPYVTDFSNELHDQAPKSSMSQVATLYVPLWYEGRIKEEDFIDQLYRARKTAMAATARKQNRDGTFNRMPYFIEALAEQTLEIVDDWAAEDAKGAYRS